MTETIREIQSEIRIHEKLHDYMKKYHDNCGSMCQLKGVEPEKYCQICLEGLN